MKINTNWFSKLALAVIFLVFWNIPAPPGVNSEGIHLFAIFVVMIFSIIFNVLSMGAANIIALSIAISTKTLTFNQAFLGYSNPMVWLVLGAFFVSHGMIQTGLGKRIACKIISLIGKNTLGMGYAIAIAELALSPIIPSVTARSGGVIYPILESIIDTIRLNKVENKYSFINIYLILVAFQTTVVSSAMFVTSIVGNSMIIDFAKKMQIYISWSDWAIGAVLPGIISLLIIPLFLYIVLKIKFRKNENKLELVKSNTYIANLGKMTSNEKYMVIIFISMIFGWIYGDDIGMHPSAVILLATTIMLITNLIKWNNLIKLSVAWDTFIWFGALISLSDALNVYGLTSWFGIFLSELLINFNSITAMSCLLLTYFYMHYFFASSTAHVSALFLPFLSAAIYLNIPAVPAVLSLGYASSLFGGITHYGIGPAPILFGSGYVDIKTWWFIGFITSILNIIIWFTVGPIWWHFVGLY